MNPEATTSTTGLAPAAASPEELLPGRTVWARWHTEDPWRLFHVQRHDADGLRLQIATPAPEGKRWNLRQIPYGAGVELGRLDGGDHVSMGVWTRVGATSRALKLRGPAQ